MSDIENPYKSPAAPLSEVQPQIYQGNLTENMLIYLKNAAPWIRFIGILGFIFSGLIAVWGLVSFTLVPLFGQVMESITGGNSTGIFSGFFSIVYGGASGILILGSAAVVFVPSLFLYRSGDKLRAYMRTGTEGDLEEAFKNNKSFWKFCGIVSIVYLAFIPVVIIISVIAAVIWAAAI